MPKVLLVISARVPAGAEHAADRSPRKDYLALARALDATILDPSSIDRSRVARAVARWVGPAAALAWLAFRTRRRFDAVLTDGEHIGIPLALLLKLSRATTPHVTIGHRITAQKKRPFFRWLRVHTHITRIALHSQRQIELAIEQLGIPAAQLAFVPYQADAAFWRPLPVQEERMICSAGLEFRDYPTLYRAIEGLDVQAVIGAASHWSHRRNTALTANRPPNVTVDSFDYVALRDLYARAAGVVVPLDDVDFQAGITTILEAMAMGKPVIVTHTQGQVDVIEDRRKVTRGTPPREPMPRPVSLLHTIAEQQDVTLEPNGFYVPPRDADALRRAIVYLLDHPDERARLGAAGRRAVDRLMNVDCFAERLRALVEQACAAPPAPAPRAPVGLRRRQPAV
jgi:glycosyltransferase involved in cell wall biosynthesis